MADSGITFRSQEFGAQQDARGVQAQQEDRRARMQQESIVFQQQQAQQRHQLEAVQAQSAIQTEQLRRQDILQKIGMTAHLRELDMQGIQRDLLDQQLQQQKFALEQARKQAEGEVSDKELMGFAWSDYMPPEAFTRTADGKVKLSVTPEAIKEAQRGYLNDPYRRGHSSGVSDVPESMKLRVRELQSQRAALLKSRNPITGELLPEAQKQIEGLNSQIERIIGGGGPQAQIPQQTAETSSAGEEAYGQPQQRIPEDRGKTTAQQERAFTFNGAMLGMLSRDPEFSAAFNAPKYQVFSGPNVDPSVGAFVAEKIAAQVSRFVNAKMSFPLAKTRVLEMLDKDPKFMGDILDDAGVSPEQRDLYLRYHGYIQPKTLEEAVRTVPPRERGKAIK